MTPTPAKEFLSLLPLGLLRTVPELKKF
jgi:hypothetical protein